MLQYFDDNHENVDTWSVLSGICLGTPFENCSLLTLPRTICRVFDRAGMGMIPAEEFCHQAQILGDRFSQAEADALLSYAKDGKLNYADLFKQMTE